MKRQSSARSELTKLASEAPSSATSKGSSRAPEPCQPSTLVDSNSSFSPSKLTKSGSADAVVPKAGLAARHTYSMALTAGIGTGLWIATASGLYYGGPLGLILGFSLVGLMLYFLMAAMTEMISLHPHIHGFFGFVQDFLGDTVAFALCYNYLFLWLFCFPAELVAATEILQLLWKGVPVTACIAVFLVFCVLIQVMPSKVYGESEFIFAITKLIGLIVAIVTIIVIDAGGFSAYKPSQKINWQPRRLWGIGGLGPLQVFLGAGFAMGGIELFTLAVLETSNPRRSAKNNIVAIVARLVFCYILTVSLFGTVIYSGTETLKTTTSPIFVALQLAQCDALRATMIVVVLLTLVSASNTCTYLIKQSVLRTAHFGYLPVPEKYLHHFTNRTCWPAIVLSIAFGSIAFITVAPSGARAFEYLMSLVAMNNYITWTCMFGSYCRFRQALSAFRKSNDENAAEPLPYTAFGPVWLRNIFIAAVLATAFLASNILAIKPLGDDKFTALKFICKTGCMYGLIAIFIFRLLFLKSRRGRALSTAFPKVDDMQPVVRNYITSYHAYRLRQDEETQIA